MRGGRQKMPNVRQVFKSKSFSAFFFSVSNRKVRQTITDWHNDAAGEFERKKKKKTPNHRQTVDNTENQHKSSHHSLPTFLIDFLPAFLFGRVDFSHRFYLTRTHFQPNFSISMRVILRASIHFAVQLTRSRRLSISRSFHLHRFYFIHFYCFSTLAHRAIFHHSKLISF